VALLDLQSPLVQRFSLFKPALSLLERGQVAEVHADFVMLRTTGPLEDRQGALVQRL
jgi:hypothetical protein